MRIRWRFLEEWNLAVIAKEEFLRRPHLTTRYYDETIDIRAKFDKFPEVSGAIFAYFFSLAGFVVSFAVFSVPFLFETHIPSSEDWITLYVGCATLSIMSCFTVGSVFVIVKNTREAERMVKEAEEDYAEILLKQKLEDL